jgi:hypothetical protein
MILKLRLLVNVPPGVVTTTLPVIAPLVEHTERKFLPAFRLGTGLMRAMAISQQPRSMNGTRSTTD